MPNRCKTPIILMLSKDNAAFMTKRPRANNFIDLITIFCVIWRLVKFFLVIDLMEKVKLTPIMNMNHGMTRSATVNPDHGL